MGQNINDVRQWREIIAAIRNNDDEKAIELLTQRERKLDAYFSYFSHENFTPVLYQNAAAVAATNHYVEGFRIGPYVWYKGKLSANAAGTANGYVAISLPPFLPQVAPNAASYACGVMQVYDASANIHQTGVAFQSSAILANTIACIDDATAAFLGQAGTSFTAAFAAGDIVSWAVMYQTSVAQ